MIFGECPYCDGFMSNGIAEICPAFQKIVHDCGKTVWLYHSRLNPVAYTEESFHEKYSVDEETKEISEKKEEGKVKP